MSADDPYRDDTAGSRIVRVPADVNRPDPILAGLTARQLAVLAATGAALYAAHAATRTELPPTVAAGAGVVVAGAVLAVATLRRDGIGVDRLLLAAVRHWRSPRRLVPRPGRPVPGWAGLAPAAMRAAGGVRRGGCGCRRSGSTTPGCSIWARTAPRWCARRRR